MRGLILRFTLSIAWLAPMMAAHADGTQIAGIDWRMNTTLQALEDSEHYGSFFNDETDNSLNLEGRFDIHGNCTASWCAGTSLVVKPRVRYFDDQSSTAGLPQPKSFAWDEAYSTGAIGQDFTWLIGKRYLSWGPGLLYSPTNRLFPDNGASTPRREIAGKTLGMVSESLSPEWTLYGVYANPYLQSVPGIDERGGFGLVRAEYANNGERPTTAGTVVGGGGGYRPYIGGYAQHILNDAWTIGAEFSASYGYASETEAGSDLREDEHRPMADALVNLRYGLPSGGELGVEFVYNGYHLSDAELQNPLLAAQPSGGIWQTRTRPLHPLPEGRYLLLQALEPSLFGDKRFSLVMRSITGLSSHDNSTFVELSYSPRDNVTLFLGVTQTFGPSDSEMVRSLGHGVYAALEFYL